MSPALSRRAFLGGLPVAAATLPLFGQPLHAQSPRLPPPRLRPWPDNPWYWAYGDTPVLLLGASADDNLFQWPDLDAHLDEMVAAGANYIRNTMSDRPDGGFEVYPYARQADGRFDLTQWNPEYWRRFEHMLTATASRGVFVQIELWDRFDHSRGPWQLHPYNPANTGTYTHESSGLAATYPNHPGRNEQPFFFSTPAQRHNTVLLPIQQRFADAVLDRTLPHGHVLYCIDNETNGDEAWSTYWAEHLARRARAAGVEVFITEMWDAHDLRAAEHRRTFDNPERYAFVDVSQNNHQTGQAHWDNLQWVRTHLSARPRPINAVKTYGADAGPYGTTHDGLARWWRHLIGGVAAVRFHRPPSGLGLSAPAAASVRAARLLTSRVPVWQTTPANQLLLDRPEDGAYLSAAPGRAYAVFFPRAVPVHLDLRADAGAFVLQWIDIGAGALGPSSAVSGGASVPLRPPAEGIWAAAVTRGA